MSKISSIALAALGALAMACDPAAIDRTADCADICSRYKDCIQSDYDVKSCSEDCRDMVSDENTERIDDCEECLDGNSCTGSVFNCASECAGIVP